MYLWECVITCRFQLGLEPWGTARHTTFITLWASNCVRKIWRFQFSGFEPMRKRLNKVIFSNCTIIVNLPKIKKKLGNYVI